jgi:hypothetical protein
MILKEIKDQIIIGQNIFSKLNNMGKLTYLVIHCSDTPLREITLDDLTRWHKGAKKNKDGSYTFMDKYYTLDQLKKLVLQLPSGKKVPADKTNGNGWSRLGYADMINPDGKLINVTPYDFDEKIDAWEITYGAAGGVNSIGRHVMLHGGWHTNGIKNGKNADGSYMEPDELYTDEQLNALVDYIKIQKMQCPDILVCGHNELDGILKNKANPRTCPNFDVQKFLVKHNLK